MENWQDELDVLAVGWCVAGRRALVVSYHFADREKKSSCGGILMAFILFLKGIKHGFRQFADMVAFLVNTLLLTVVYVVGVGPTALVARLRGKKFMELETDNKQKSYWEKHMEPKTEDYFRMF